MGKWIERFKTPLAEDKPKLRYWMPHGVVSEAGIVKDVADIAERGFGSIEAVAMTRGLRDGFYTRANMWGEAQWLEAMRVLLREAKRHGLRVDISNGPGWPIVDIRAKHADDETTLYELAYGLKILEPGEIYNGDPPKPEVIHAEGTVKPVAVSLYRICPIGEKMLDFETYRPLPVNETLHITTPTDGQYALFAFYGRPSMQMYGDFYVMDHFSEKAADAVMDYWEEKIVPALSENIDVLESIFCDSLEYRVDLEWTRTFERDFEAKKGYSILPYLPALGSEKECMPTNGTYFCREGVVYEPSRNESVYPKTNICGYSFSDPVLAHKVNMDFMEMITALYDEKHVARMQARAEKMGLGVRYQVAYGRTLEMECSALFPAIPENEGLGSPAFDRYRAMAGAVHLARKPIYSFECAAEAFNSYGQTHEDILWWMKRAYVGGINAQVLHGGHYCGYYDGEGNENGLGPGIDWPGFEGFTRRTWSNAWNRTLDKTGQKTVLNSMARVNFLLRNPHKIDIAVYRQAYLSNGEGAGDGSYFLKDGNWLNRNGYTYEFLSDKLLAHENARVTGGVLDAEGAAYKVLLIANETYMDYETAVRIQAFAEQGLPVVFVGQKPTRVSTNRGAYDDAALNEVIKSVPCEYVTDITLVAQVLQKAGILPDMLPDSLSQLYSAHVKIENGDFYYVYNGNPMHTLDEKSYYPTLDKKRVMFPYNGKLSLRGAGNVYEIDAFSACVRKIPSTLVNGRVEFCADFVRDEAKIYAVLPQETAKALGVLGAEEEALVLQNTVEMQNFKLTVTEILPPENKVGTFYESVYKTHEPIMLKKLVPWREIPFLYRACGIGVYETTVLLENVPHRAVLCTDRVTDTYKVRVNGTEMPFADPVKGETDITKALHMGENKVEIEVYTTLQNVASLDFLLAEGKKTKPQAVGLWGKVCLKCYEKEIRA